MNYVFRYTTWGGSGDGYDGPIQVNLSDEQVARVEAYILSGKSDELTRVDPLKDVYDKVRRAISSHEMSSSDLDYIREFGEEDEDGEVDLDEAMDSYLDAVNLTIYFS